MNQSVQSDPIAAVLGDTVGTIQDEFKSRLVNDVFGRDNDGQVPMEKVMLLIWKFRDDPDVVQFMAQFVTKYSGRRNVFDGIQYLNWHT